ncbi:MAG: asparaginase domain-containing protein [Pseudomonadota bacterium]|nr:asparaginase domain-containing protein [Pseudomonadota bacterium]
MIQLFVTGGTIDKQYDAIKGELTFAATYIPSLLKEANCTLDIDVNVLMQKDSLQMTDFDRQQINQACSDCSANQIVITHGTDTMVDTALTLQNNINLTDKTIVITGAMRPYKLGDSDASFNIGSALQAVQLASAGVWISMNGQLFSADHVIKNRTLGQFEAN